MTAPSGVTDPTPGNNSATDTDYAKQHGGFEYYEDGRQCNLHAGSRVTYTVVVSNTGPSDAVGATVADNAPAGRRSRAGVRICWRCDGHGEWQQRHQ